jgi:hypothetical protein
LVHERFDTSEYSLLHYNFVPKEIADADTASRTNGSSQYGCMNRITVPSTGAHVTSAVVEPGTTES